MKAFSHLAPPVVVLSLPEPAQLRIRTVLVRNRAWQPSVMSPVFIAPVVRLWRRVVRAVVRVLRAVSRPQPREVVLAVEGARPPPAGDVNV
jgi:hypothetical protein